LFKLCGHGWFVQHGVIPVLGFGWRYIPDRLQKPSMIEPIDPFQGGELHRIEAAPWSTPIDDFGLVESVDRFGEGVVVTVADASDRRFDASFCQSLGIPNGHVLNAAIRVMHEAASMSGAPIMKCLLGDR
jgi:hypothetical protein